LIYDEGARKISGSFLESVERVVERCNWLCHAYCLMTNHYYLLIETAPTLSRGMRHLNGSYTQAVNRRSGHVFQGRFKAILVDKDACLLGTLRYIH
jgi:REP element-mobilizing transposase RayT